MLISRKLTRENYLFVNKGFPLLNHVVKKLIPSLVIYATITSTHRHIIICLCPYLMRANNGKPKSLLYNSDCAIDLPVLSFLLLQITAIKVAT